MSAATAVPSVGPRYAPEDPTLPKPWKGLVDGSTGYLYFWNPETNVTQYERPVSSGSAALPRSSVSLSSSVQIYQSFHGDSASYENTFQGSVGNNGPDIAQLDRYQQQTDRNGIVEPHQDVPSNNAGSYGYSGTFGVSLPATSAVEPTDISAEAYRRRHEITVTGGSAPPLTTFETTGFPPEILKEVHASGFTAPTPIQAQSWPIVLRGRDIVAIAKTGSGKTLGYLIPGFLHLKRCRNNPQHGPTILIISPTRELATQIQDEAVKFGRSSHITCTCVYGGAPKGAQLKDLDRGVDIVVATPGRLNDILEMRRVSLRQVSYLVLDEADRMLDMGFEPQIRKIVNEVPARRQTLMFTATWPKEVRKIAADLLTSPVQVNIGNVDELVANKSITQHVEIIPGAEKLRRLEQILRSQEPGSKVIVFCSTKRMCDQLARSLSRGFGAAAIHGDKSQADRDYVLGQFRSGRSPVLVATDVAARGLDIKDIRVVVNYDFPTGVEDYVHRIGRTGRAGATGLAYTFFCDSDARFASDLIKVLEGANQRVPPELRGMSSYGGTGGGGRRRWGPPVVPGGRGRGGGGAEFSSRPPLPLPGGGGGTGWSGNRDSSRDRSRYGGHDRNFGGDRSSHGGRDRTGSPGGGGYRNRDRSRSAERSSWGNHGGGSHNGPSSGFSFHKSMMQPGGARAGGGEADTSAAATSVSHYG